MTALFYNKNEKRILEVVLVESIRTGYKQYKMIHELEQPGAQFKLPREQLYWIVKARGSETLYLCMDEYSLEAVEE